MRGWFNAAIVLPHSWKSALVPLFAGIARRTGFVGEARYGVLNDARPLDAAALPRMVDRFSLLAEPRGAQLPAETPHPRLEADADAVAATMARYGLAAGGIALCIGAEYGPAKRWPAAHFAALARALLAAGRGVWLIGGPGDAPIGAEVGSLAPGAVDLTGKTTLGEAIELIGAADAVVTNDSGLMHVAAALGRPLVALYGSTSPAFTPPLSAQAVILKDDLECSPCFERVCPLGHFRCLNELAPARVLAAVERQLSG
jgi:heptosyltransferase-2